MSTTNDFDNEKVNPFEAASITPSDLARFTAKQLVVIAGYTPGLTPGSTDPTLLKWLEGRRFTAEDRRIILKVMASRASGTGTVGQSLEEATRTTGSVVHYTKEKVTVTSKTGEIFETPNTPVLAPLTVTAREGSAFLIPFLVANFDIDQGKLVYIREARKLREYWSGTRSRVQVEGIVTVYEVLSGVLRRTSCMKEVFTDGKTAKGNAFADLIHNTCATCSIDDYWLLHTTIIRACWSRCRVSPADSAGIVKLGRADYIERTGDATRTIAAWEPSSWKLVDPNEDKDRYAFFLKRYKVYPRLIVGPIPGVHMWSPMETVTAEVMCNDYRLAMDQWGGNKRGIGKVAMYINYAPKMSKEFRHLNMLIMLMESAKEQDMEIDVHPSRSVVPLLLDYLQREKNKELNKRVQIVVRQQDLIAVPYHPQVVIEPRPNAHHIVIDTWSDAPDVRQLTKAKKDPTDTIAASFARFVSSMQVFKKYTVLTKVYCEQFFKAHNVFRLRLGHDLSAIVSNTLKYVVPPPGVEHTPCPKVTWQDWIKHTNTSMKVMNSWAISPINSYSPICKWFSFVGAKVSWSEESNEWVYVPDTIVPVPQVEADAEVQYDDAPVNTTTTTSTTTTTTGAPVTTQSVSLASQENRSTENSSNVAQRLPPSVTPVAAAAPVPETAHFKEEEANFDDS